MSVTCPTEARWEGDIVGCGSTNVSEPDDEGLIDCLDCGLFFHPAGGRTSARIRVQELMAEHCVSMRKLVAVMPAAGFTDRDKRAAVAAAVVQLEKAVVALAPENVQVQGGEPKKPRLRLQQLICCCCGSATHGRQWWNRDKGYGLCDGCIESNHVADVAVGDIASSFGVRGYHWDVGLERREES